ncbi:MAG: NADH-quinone oxidoreductase subunit F [Myxococcota bacterium]|jgi:NADH-quinone oxidoreductase subunit F
MADQLRNLLRDTSKDFTSIDTAIKAGDYSRLRTWLRPEKKQAIIDEVKAANLRGRGGAGFPAGLKWSFVPQDGDKPKYLVVNADEGEPGTFKDRYWLEHDPHPMIEGCILCAWALNIETVYIYIRGEFVRQAETTDRAIADAYKRGFLGQNILGTGFNLEMHTHLGAGAYICGEETAMLESLEGKPGQPRLKPPFPAVVGLFGCPTVINNVETLVNVPLILEHGGEAFHQMGVERNGGTKVFGVSGHVNKPGLYEFPLGAVTLRELIYDHCGGILDGRELKAVVPGGASCPVVTADELDVSMDFDALKSVGSMLGTAGVIVIAEPTCIVRSLIRFASFYAHESCGQCTPCREGCSWLERVLRAIEDGRGRPEHIELLLSVAGQMEGNTICAHGDAAAWPVQGVLKKFLPEVMAHIDNHCCPYDGVEGQGGDAWLERGEAWAQTTIAGGANP